MSGSEPVSDVTFILHGLRTEAAPVTGCDLTAAPGYSPRSGLPPALCRVRLGRPGTLRVPGGAQRSVSVAGGESGVLNVRCSFDRKLGNGLPSYVEEADVILPSLESST